jgi:lysophospholipase L1-like esterase
MPRLAVLLAASVVAAGLAAPAAQAAPGLYVALGDSYTAGPLIPTQYGDPFGCARSTNNYPSVVAHALPFDAFRDESCSSAETKHMTAPQTVTGGGVHRPQFDALSPDAALVTVGIGGNDVGLVGAAEECAARGALNPTGTACRDRFAPGGVDEIQAQIVRTAPRIAAVLQGIHQRSPRARVALVGYPDVLPRTGSGCYPMVPLSADDVRYFDGLIRSTNAMLAEQATANDAEYVDTYDDSVGHDVCTLPPTRWFEGLLPTAPAFPLHPNAEGEASMGRSVLRVLRAAPPAPAITALRRSPRTVRAGRGVRLSFTLDRPAAVRIAVRRGGRLLRTVRVAGHRGVNRVALGARRLGRRSGAYRLTLTPEGRLRTGATVGVSVRVARRRR